MDLMDNTIMLGGPVKMHPRVLRAMSVPARAHRDPDFIEMLRETKEFLQYVFQSKQDVALLFGSGTASMDAAVSNIVKKGDKMLAIHNGKFSQRLYEIGNTYAEADELAVEWGKAPDIDAVAEKLESGDYRAVSICMNESSTGLTNPVKEVGKLVKKHDAIYIVDGITAVGGLDVKPEEIGADIVLLGSQKCVAGPAGLSAVSVSERYKERMYTDTTYYLNLKKHLDKMMQKNDTPFTSAIPLVQGFHEALKMVKEEGIENRIKRTRNMAEATRAAVEALNLELFPDKRYASDTLSAINYPEGITDKDFRGILKEKYGVVIAGGQAHIKGKIFRIGHMGQVRMVELLGTFGAIEAVLRQLGYTNFTPGEGVAAIEEYI